MLKILNYRYDHIIELQNTYSERFFFYGIILWNVKWRCVFSKSEFVRILAAYLFIDPFGGTGGLLQRFYFKIGGGYVNTA